MSARNLLSTPRGFAWALSPLQRKLDLALEQARSSWGDLQRHAATGGQELEALRQHEAGQAAVVDAASRLSLDPQARARGLRYLTALAARVASQSQEQEAIARRVETARADCLALEVKIACLDQVRDRLLEAHRREKLAREAREADLSWLGERQRRSAAQARSSGGVA